MKAAYARLFTDEFGEPCIEDGEIELSPGFAVPPAEPLHTAPFLLTDGSTFWIGAPPHWNGRDPHPAPRRMVFVTVRGEYEVTVTRGVIRRFPIGSVLIVEDTTGIGHTTRVTSTDDCIIFAAGLPPKEREGGHPLISDSVLAKLS
jgi:hypothetical protein